MSNKNDDMKKKIATGILVGASITGIASSAVLAANTSTTIDNEVARTVMDSASTRSARSGRKTKEEFATSDKPAVPDSKIINTQEHFSSYIPVSGPHSTGRNQIFKHNGFQDFYQGSLMRQYYGYITSSNKTTFTVYTGLFKADGKLYYSDSNGDIQTGLRTINDKTYYFGENKTGAYARQGWQRIKGKTYYFKSNGEAIKGFVDIGQHSFYFNEKGEREEGFFKDGKGNLYYSNEKGDIVTGWYTVGKNTYLFDAEENGAARKSYWYEDPTGKAYLDENGYMAKGIKKIKGETYLFTDRKDNKNKKVFYQDFGFYTDTTTGNRYHFDEEDDGKAHRGWLIDGRKGEIYFDADTGIMAKPGIITVKGEKYWVTTGPDGKNTYKTYGLYTDPQTKATYFFDDRLEGKAIKNGTKEYKGVTYQFDKEGKCIGKWRVGR